jgi:hypothetical protein
MPGLFEVPQNPPKLLAKNPAKWRGIQAICSLSFKTQMACIILKYL